MRAVTVDLLLCRGFYVSGSESHYVFSPNAIYSPNAIVAVLITTTSEEWTICSLAASDPSSSSIAPATLKVRARALQVVSLLWVMQYLKPGLCCASFLLMEVFCPCIIQPCKAV
ncbi:hypothetical protein M758_7G098200 [Ceratodon purpureus]|uniref:Uncharacterized protein n=1 Tax=Ceratodon purpureus TaxID=3225 RepID=A0A8T0H6Z8_CERPU|nr:hypothetical protein KC19_7G104000 [Ceratodon purpureus]KAG0610870.1 hypothetical protein M758_7G098200 [Ceratodon purpureus]